MKGNKLKGGYLLAIIILAVGLLAMALMLRYAKSFEKAKVTSISASTTSSTTRYEDITTDALPDENNDNKVTYDVKNFKASLADILYYNPLIGNYKLELVYKGAGFSFTCGKYDSDNSKCVSGSATMNTGKAILPLYTYEKDEDDYTSRLTDYYIIVNDNYIILTFSNTGKKAGLIKIYDKEGNFKGELKDVITGYYEGEELINQLYPNIKDGYIYYYYCSNNNVKARGAELTNLNNTLHDEAISNSRCY